jgi:hypothetical protein
MKIMSDGLEYVDMGTDDPNVFGCKVTGTLTGAAMSGFAERVEKIHTAGNKARIYVDVTSYGSFEMSVIKEKFSAMGTFWSGIGKLAYVVDQNWMANMIGLVDAVTPMHLRAFGADQDAEARAWVLADD